MSTIMRASHQWATRPADERFVSLTDMLEYKQRIRANSVSRVISNRSIQVEAIENDMRGLQIIGPNSGPTFATNWSFGQMCSLIKAPSAYMRTLPAPLAADCLTYGLMARDVEDIGALVVHDPASGRSAELAAMTGPNYGRIWDSEIIGAIVDRFGDGRTGLFRVPGEFGKAVPITKANTTLYASDRDMFVFLVDEKNRIEIPGRRAGMHGDFARGFFVWNSEVGSKTFGVATFLYDYVCCNRIIWGAEEYREITIRHTSGAPDRWIEEIAPAIEAYANSTARNVTEAIEQAKAKRLETDVLEFLTKRRQYTHRMANLIIAAHNADEGRPMETIFDVVTGVTAYARGVTYQDQRVDLERDAGRILDLAA